MTATTARAPSFLYNWLISLLLAAFVFGTCWTGAILHWRAHAGDPGTGEMLVYLFALPAALLIAAVLVRKRLTSITAPAMPAVHATRPLAASSPATPTLPLTILATTLRSPHGATDEEVFAALLEKTARPSLDASLVDTDGFPLMTARCPDAEEAALQDAIAAWLTANALPGLFNAEQWRALVLATQVAEELATDTMRVLAEPVKATAVLQLAPVLPADWTANQRDAASQWLRHTVVQSGWPAEHIAMVMQGQADISDVVPATLLTQLATRAPDATVVAMVLACDSRIGTDAVQDWTAAKTLFTPGHPEGQIPGEGAVGMLLTDLAQVPAAIANSALFAILEPLACAQRGANPALLANLAQTVLTASHTEASALTMIVADTGPTTARMVELMGYAGTAPPQLDDQKDVIGVCGAVPALTALAMARLYACERNGPTLWLTNQDPYQCCAALLRPPPAG
jgi:hypothetical protein